MFDLEAAGSKPVSEVKPKKGKTKAPAGCMRCKGSPWVTGVAGVKWEAKRCNCARGRYLAAKDAERKERA